MSSRTVVALVVNETEHHLDLPVWCQFCIEFPVNVLYVNVTPRKQRTEREAQRTRLQGIHAGRASGRLDVFVTSQ